jgi:metal-sulfur cluster biosynthetic enzyme
VSSLEDHVRAALGEVFDPCSLAVRAPISIVDMGMVARIAVGPAGRVEIGLRPTSPMCTMIAGIMEAAETHVRRLPGVREVEISLERAGLWTEEDMTPRGREILLVRRERSRREVPPGRGRRPAGIDEAR